VPVECKTDSADTHVNEAALRFGNFENNLSVLRSIRFGAVYPCGFLSEHSLGSGSLEVEVWPVSAGMELWCESVMGDSVRYPESAQKRSSEHAGEYRKISRYQAIPHTLNDR
jgi:hypothetical protein